MLVTDRLDDFKKIEDALKHSCKLSSKNIFLAGGDSLELISKIPKNSISLILTDPPYHSTKKKNIYGDTSFEEDRHYLEWIEKYAVEWKRILKLNGSLFCFCSSQMSARLEVMLSKEFNILSQIVWTKPNEPGFDGWKGKMKKSALRQWYPYSERILFAEPSVEGNLFKSPFANLLQKYRKQSGLSMHELTATIGAHGKVNHGGAVSNWEAGRNTPNREQYEKIRSAILATGKVKEMPVYEDAIRVFKMEGSREFTDVWTFPSVRPYQGKHPAEKPMELLEHAIEATTYQGDIVLDCFGGSGNIALAAFKLKRLAVCIEIDPYWINSITSKIKSLEENTIYGNQFFIGETDNYDNLKNKENQLPLSYENSNSIY